MDPLIREALPRDDVAAVITAAFADAGAVAALWRDVTDHGHARASLVALVDDRVVGHVGLSHGWLDARESLVDLLVLSPLSVTPGQQGAGIGTALVRAAIAAADRIGAPMVVLEGSPGYYGERGFRAAAGIGVEAASTRTPAPACQVATLAAYEDWMRGRIVYRDVWWEHDSAGLRDPELAEVERTLGA